jgi:hypothetical protein
MHFIDTVNRPVPQTYYERAVKTTGSSLSRVPKPVILHQHNHPQINFVLATSGAWEPWSHQ